MDRSNLVIALESERYECGMVGTFLVDTIYKVASSLNHSLVDEFLEWFVGTRITAVIQELVPETRVNQVTCGMLCTTDIQVNVLPIFVSLFAHQSLVVVRVHIAKVISR